MKGMIPALWLLSASSLALGAEGFKLQFQNDSNVYYESFHGYCRIRDQQQLAAFGGNKYVYLVNHTKEWYFRSRPFLGSCLYPDNLYERGGVFYRLYKRDRFCTLPEGWKQNLLTYYPGHWHATRAYIFNGRYNTGTCTEDRVEEFCRVVRTQYQGSCHIDPTQGLVRYSAFGWREEKIVTLDDILRGETTEEKLHNLYTLKDGIDEMNNLCALGAGLCGVVTLYLPKQLDSFFKVVGIGSCTYLFSTCQSDVAHAATVVDKKIEVMREEWELAKKQRESEAVVQNPDPAGSGGGGGTELPEWQGSLNIPIPSPSSKKPVVDIIDLPSTGSGSGTQHEVID